MAFRRSTTEDYRRRLLRAEQLLEEKLDSEIRPAELAGASAFSLHHFHRIFKAQLGETVMQRVRRLRLERSARRLRASEERILTIALEAGYESHEAFTRAFVEHFGFVPSEYREQTSQRVEDYVRAHAGRPRAPVSVVRYAPLRVVFVRHRGSYQGIDAFWAQVMGQAAEHGLLERAAPFYGVCPDDPEVTPEEQLRFDGCVAVDEGFDVTALAGGAWSSALIPGGSYAVGLHIGPFHRLAETYLDVIGHWFPSSGYELAPEPVVEHYLDDPRATPENELRTEVRVKIAELP